MPNPILIPVQIGSHDQEHWNDIEARQLEYGDHAAPYLRDQVRPSIAQPSIAWSSIGLEPKWIGADTADCVAALEPSVYHGQGPEEFQRFLEGSRLRDELAIVFSSIGKSDPKSNVTSMFASSDDSVDLGAYRCSIASRRLGNGARVLMSSGLTAADRDLALRLLNDEALLSWSSLSIVGSEWHAYDGVQVNPPVGSLEPILETSLGEPVVAAWVSPDGSERRYIVPFDVDWTVVLNWLVVRGLPAMNPAALVRARATNAVPDQLLTYAERSSLENLAEVERHYVDTKATAELNLLVARDAATTVRDGLLYGTGAGLVSAVANVFSAAGIDVVDLDEALGETSSADLLCSYQGRVRLVEVKATSGNAGERLYGDLLRHLREWPGLPNATPIEGGVLVLNHEHKKEPLDRTREPYSREGFLAAQNEGVVTSLQLFETWRDEDWTGLRALVFDPFGTPETGKASHEQVDRGQSSAPRDSPNSAPRPWWKRGQRKQS
ncbi:hypothetical protein [Subtercola endophyticus]|uniref:hypothetical protein n=1 Tax=Subtercola endophyticus TaxID=2895559 RepID=UPI001E445BA7|nr:hypothetical protein [Subtercola endophyticus]UFS57639.1 hypothetical protein LQ955_11265 [Subtercola endophyticus]